MESCNIMKKIKNICTLFAVAVAIATLGLSASSEVSALRPSDICGNYSTVKKTISSTGVLRVVGVSTEAELAAAVTSALPGDVIELDDGVYEGITELYGLQGTATNPVTVQSKNHLGAVLTRSSSSYTPLLIHLGGNTHLNILGIDVFGGNQPIMTQNVVTGISNSSGGSANLATGDVSNILISHNRVHDFRLSAIQIGGPMDGSNHIKIGCNEIYNTGMDTINLDGKLLGEGVYIGNGQSVDAEMHDIEIYGNNMYAIGSEAVDIKAKSYNITIRDNLIHDFDPAWTGAIALGVNQVDYQDGNYLVEGNYIWNISTYSPRPGNANGIVPGHGTTTIRNNVIWNIDDEAISFYERDTTGDYGIGFGSADNRTVNIHNNTMFNCGDACIGEHPIQATNPLYPSIRLAINNIGDSNNPEDEIVIQSSANYIATASDFIGPVTGTADAGFGPGSGLALSPSSPAVNTAAEIGGFSGDVLGLSRFSGLGWDFGAFSSAGMPSVSITDPYVCGGSIFGGVAGGTAPYTVTIDLDGVDDYSFTPTVASSGEWEIPLNYVDSSSRYYVQSGDYTNNYSVTDSNGLEFSGVYNLTISGNCEEEGVEELAETDGQDTMQQQLQAETDGQDTIRHQAQNESLVQYGEFLAETGVTSIYLSPVIATILILGSLTALLATRHN